MKLTRILSLPFTLVADVVTLGNFGDGSFTQQVFDAEEREQRVKDELDALRILAPAIEKMIQEAEDGR